jgi:phosphatidyl-myo-inositol alpha-mannosyltransferase
VSGGLRVGLVCPYSFDTRGGVQSHVVGLARFLRAAGHEARILAPGVPAADMGVDSHTFTSAGGAVAVPYNGSVARVSFGPTSAARVRRWLRDGNFDVVHIHEPVAPSISLLTLWATQVPIVGTFHAATPRSRSMQLAGDVLRTLINKVAFRIAVSESARGVVGQYLGKDATVIPNGFHFTEFADRHHLVRTGRRWRGGARPRLTFLGRADERRKGLSVLIDALPLIMTHHPDLDVAIAGDGGGRLPKSCRKLGALTDQAKARLLRTTDVFVAPQLERESFGIVLLEAMAASAAVVASDLDPFLDLLRPAGTDPLGQIFPRGDSKALAEATLTVLSKPDDDRTERARQASRRYDWAAIGPEIVDAYRIAHTAQSGRSDSAALAGSATLSDNRRVLARRGRESLRSASISCTDPRWPASVGRS